MKLLKKTAVALVFAATAFAGLTATPAAAHDRRGDSYYGNYDRGGWYGDSRYDRHDRYREHRRREWRKHHRRYRHHAWRDRDRYDDDWRYDRARSPGSRLGILIRLAGGAHLPVQAGR